jgi:ElaB/YqjD/DUF883 family membrane-anchored ribosome-binding protein
MSSPIRPLSGTEFPAPAALPDERMELLAEERVNLLPEAEDRSKLEGAAETVGATLGRAVNKVREIPRRFTVIKGGASDKASEVAEEASARIDELKVEARTRAAMLRSQARTRAAMLRHQVRQYIHDYPLQCLGGVFGAAFLAGMTLRIWRTRD